MCTVSSVGDTWGQTFPQRHPWVVPSTGTSPTPNVFVMPPMPPSRAEFDALKREIEELKELLKAAKKFDEATGQPDCQMDEKVELIRRIAELVGVDLEGVL